MDHHWMEHNKIHTLPASRNTKSSERYLAVRISSVPHTLRRLWNLPKAFEWIQPSLREY